MPSSAEMSASINAVAALKAAQPPDAVSTFRCTLEIRHRAGIALVYPGKKATALGFGCMLRLALPPNTPIPTMERLLKLGGINISIHSEKVRWSCNWMSQFMQRDWTQPLNKKEQAQLAMAKFIMVGIEEEETRRSRKSLKKEAADMDWEAEWRKYKKELEASRPKLKKKKKKKVVEEEEPVRKKKKHKKDKKKLMRRKRS